MKKKRKFLGGSGGMPLPSPPPPPPHPPCWKILKVETKICAIFGILEANLKKCSTPKFMTNISFVPSICIHRSITLIFTEKKYACRFFSMENIFDIHFRENPRFCDEYQALSSAFSPTAISYTAAHLPPRKQCFTIPNTLVPHIVAS